MCDLPDHIWRHYKVVRSVFPAVSTEIPGQCLRHYCDEFDTVASSKYRRYCFSFTLKVVTTKTGEFVNSVDPDEVAENEPPHLDLHSLPCSICIVWTTVFF